MSAGDLLVRARQLIQKSGTAGAMVIVPLALAAEVHASTVPFTFDGGSTTEVATSSGGHYLIGNAVGALTGSGQGVTLTGDTKPPVMPDAYSTSPPDLPAGLAYGAGGQLTLYWSGGFGMGTTNLLTDTLEVCYNLNLAAILAAPDDTFGDISWKLTVGVYSSPDQEDCFLMAGAVFTGTGLGCTTGSASPAFTVSDQPQFWSAQLDLTWIIPTTIDTTVAGGTLTPKYPDDRLSVTPTIDISMASKGGANPDVQAVPLPAAVWMGGALLVGVMGQGAWQRRRSAARRGR